MAKLTKASRSPAGDALKALRLDRTLKDAEFPDSLYRKGDLEVVKAVEKAQNAIDSAQRALREFMYKWRSGAYMGQGGAVYFPSSPSTMSYPPAPSTGINPAPRPVVINVQTRGGGQAQGGTHAPKPTFPPSATSGEKKGGKSKPGGRR